MAFWNYDNAKIGTTRTHRGDCSDCNNGQGKLGQQIGRDDQFIGPFDDYATAHKGALALGRKVHDCGHCHPEI